MIKAGYKQTEVGVIPEDWNASDYINFGQIIDGDRGTNYPSSIDLKDNGYCLFLNTGNVTKRGFQFSECQFISKEKDKKLNKGKLNRGDVVLTTRGTIGNFAHFIDNILYENIRINSGMVILRNILDTVDNSYLYFVFQSKIVEYQLERLSFGSAQRQLTVRGISTIKIPLPKTKTEQTAIATAISDTDALISSLEKLIAKKRNIKQGAMQTLLQPKEGWEVKTYGEIFEFLATATYSRAELTKNDEVHYIHYGDIHTKWNIFLDIKHSKLPTVTNEQVNKYSFLKNGDVIMADASEDYSGIGKSVEVKNLGDLKVIAGLHTFLLRDKNETFINGFKGYIHLNKIVKNQFDRLATGLKVYGVSKGNLKTVEIPLPSKKEQTKIAKILSDMDAEITALETKLAKIKAIKLGMMQNLLTGKIRLIVND